MPIYRVGNNSYAPRQVHRGFGSTHHGGIQNVGGYSFSLWGQRFVEPPGKARRNVSRPVASSEADAVFEAMASEVPVARVQRIRKPRTGPFVSSLVKRVDIIAAAVPDKGKSPFSSVPRSRVPGVHDSDIRTSRGVEVQFRPPPVFAYSSRFAREREGRLVVTEVGRPQEQPAEAVPDALRPRLSGFGWRPRIARGAYAIYRRVEQPVATERGRGLLTAAFHRRGIDYRGMRT